MHIPLTRQRVQEYLLAILIGLAAVAGVILYADRGPVSWMPSVRWWGLAALTVILLSVMLPQYRRRWAQRSFWLHIGSLTIVHIAAWSIVLAKASVWGLLWFVPPGMVEVALFVCSTSLGTDRPREGHCSLRWRRLTCA